MKNIVPRSYKLTNYAGNDGRFKTINPNEAIILSHLPTKWKWIARDKDGDLFLYTKKPVNLTKWDGFEMLYFPYKRLFKSIKWTDQPINIDRLLRDNL